MYNDKPNCGGVVRKGSWTDEEDNLLRKCIEKYGEGNWHRVPLRAGLKRCRKSCRLRWMNYLKPNIKRGQFNHDEVDLIIRLHKLLGNRWSLIAGRIPGRTANDVKNYWNTHLHKRISPSARPPKHPNTFPNQSNISIKNNNVTEPSQRHKTVAPSKTMQTQIIRPRPRDVHKITSAAHSENTTLNIIPPEETALRNSQEEEKDDDDDDDDNDNVDYDANANANANWWENLIEMYDNEENKECDYGPRDGPNYHSGGFSIWPTLSSEVSPSPKSKINHVEEQNIWEDEDLWNFDASVWE